MIDPRAAAAAKAAADAHLVANRRAAERESAEAAPVPMEEDLAADRAELAKRQRKRRGYCLDLAQSQWYEGDVEMTPGAGTFVMKYDDYPVERGVPAERIVADGDNVFVTWEEPSQVEDVRLPQPALLQPTGTYSRSRLRRKTSTRRRSMCGPARMAARRWSFT